MRNRKKLLTPDFMDEAGLQLLRAREDVELVSYPVGLEPSDLHRLLHDATGIALAATRYGRPELEASPAIEVVARIGVGFDAVDVPALTGRGVPLMVAGTANATSVAEHAVFMMMALAKRALELDARMRQGLWHDRKSGLPVELSGATVLVVGFGRIGTRTAPRCAAFGMHVLVYDPYVSAELVTRAGYEKVDDLAAALGRADYVTIHCPQNAETAGMFDAARLARMKRGAILVNTARGGIVDETALLEALRSGRVAGAGLDVLAQEPVGPGHPLLQLPNVISSPHVAGVTVQAMAAMSRMTALNMLSVLDGTPIRENVINKEVLGSRP
ncbi:MAG TPA: hydroxyacid dehydrogenase [Acetobacteraceae bacterium]|nr:hydroxyacid dehydrogenase [Acetobacteraceae bacterium]